MKKRLLALMIILLFTVEVFAGSDLTKKTWTKKDGTVNLGDVNISGNIGITGYINGVYPGMTRIDLPPGTQNFTINPDADHTGFTTVDCVTESTILLSGADSCEVVTGANTTEVVIEQTGISFQDLNDRFLIVVLRVENRTNLDQLEIKLSSDAFTTDDYVWTFDTSTDKGQYLVTDGEFVYLSLSFSDAVEDVAADRSAITDWSVGIKPDGTAVTAYIDAIYNAPVVDSGCKVAIGFHKQHDGQWDYGRKVLSQYNMPANLFLQPDLVDAGGGTIMTLAQIKDLYSMGYGASFIGMDNTSWLNISLADLEEDFLQGLQWFHRNDFQRGITHTTAPFSYIDSDRLALTRRYFRSNVITPTAGLTGTESGRLNSLPVIDPFRFYAVNVDTEDHPAATLTGFIDQCIINSDVLYLVFHDFAAGAAGSDATYPENDFDTVIDYLYDNHIPVITLDQLFSWAENPPLSTKVVRNLITDMSENTRTANGNLTTATIKENTLSNDGDRLILKAWGTVSGTSGAKTINCQLGGTHIIGTATYTAPEVGDWYISANMVRTGASTQDGGGITGMTHGAGNTDVLAIWDEGAEDLTTDTVIGCAAVIPSGDTVTQHGLIVDGVF